MERLIVWSRFVLSSRSKGVVYTVFFFIIPNVLPDQICIGSVDDRLISFGQRNIRNVAFNPRLSIPALLLSSKCCRLDRIGLLQRQVLWIYAKPVPACVSNVVSLGNITVVSISPGEDTTTFGITVTVRCARPQQTLVAAMISDHSGQVGP